MFAQDKYFECLSETPRICVPKSLMDEIRHAGGVRMGGFHRGVPEFLATADEQFGKLNVRHTAIDKEKMVAYVSDGKQVALLFGRMGPTNFAESRLENVACTEQLFMLHKACFPAKCSNFDECVKKILLAKKPFHAKGVGKEVKDLISAEWDAVSDAHMRASIHFACTAEGTFLRYKDFVANCPCPEMAKLIAEGKFKVYECNIEDTLWGINLFTLDVLIKLAAMFASDEEGFDLDAAMTSIAGETLNRLGKVLTDFLLTIRDMTHAEYMGKVSGVEFFKEVEAEVVVEEAAVAVEADIDSPVHKRARSDSRSLSSAV